MNSSTSRRTSEDFTASDKHGGGSIILWGRLATQTEHTELVVLQNFNGSQGVSVSCLVEDLSAPFDTRS